MEQKDYGLAAIMYTDIAGFSRMMERDEAGTLELLRYHNELIGGIVAEHHGTVIKTIGDALLVDFKNTVEAMQSALEIQDRLYAHNKEESPGLPLLVRIGVHLGDIYFFENDALGEGINIAARLQSLARPGCICFSQDVYNLVLNKIEFRAEKLGKVSLKNITKEIHAYEITTPNVEFDPDRDKPRPGYKPGTYLGNVAQGDEEGPGGEAGSDGAIEPVMALSHAPKARPVSPAESRQPPASPTPPQPKAVPPVAPPEEPILAGRLPEAERSYSLEGSRQVLDEIRKAILQDIKTEGRRLSVGEALSRYGSYGVEAKEVIASMVEGGLLVRGRADNPPEPSQSSGFPSIMFGPGGKGFDAEALGRNIEAAVKGVVGEIERNVARHEAYRGGEYAERYDRHRERYERRAERHAIKDAVRRDMAGLPTDKWDAKLRENEAWNTGSEDRSSDVEAYRQQLTGRARRQRGGLIGNIISYLAVNAGLWYASLVATGTVQFAQLAGHVTLPSFVPAIVSAAWGIGVVSSIVAAVRGGAKAREAEAMPDLNRTELETYKKLNRVRDSMAMHTASTITVPILLAVINLSLPGGSGFLWFIFPAAAMLLGYLSHLGSYGPSKRKLQRELLSSLGIEGGWRNIFRTGRARKTAGRELGPYTAQYEEAERAKAGILAEIKTGGSPVDADLGPSLESYVGQVRLLAQSANEIDRIIGAIPMGDLSADKAELQRKAEAATSTSLKDEYRRSIEEIDKQEQSFGDLKNQSEVIKLRLSSSVNQLKQMRIDMARLKAAGDDGRGGIGELKRKTEELSSYLQDLRKGYDESNDPYAELEELARQAEERKRLEDKSQGGGPGGA